MKKWLWLAFWLIVCFAVGGVSGHWTAAEIPTWYRTLARPSFAPPNWVFAPVWSALYALMAVSAWRIAVAPHSNLRGQALGVFTAQLVLNFLWSAIFFHWHQIGWALVEVVGLWMAIAGSLLVFSRVDAVAAWLMLPYLAWVSFASMLNLAYWRLNR